MGVTADAIEVAIKAVFAEMERLEVVDDLEAERIGDETPMHFVLRKEITTALIAFNDHMAVEYSGDMYVEGAFSTISREVREA